MSIVTYTTDPELFKDIADSCTAHAVEHRTGCPNGKPGWPDTSRKTLDDACSLHGCKIGYAIETYRGRVVREWERNGYDDSDFLAEVITDVDTLETKSVCWGTTRGWTYFNGCKVDASDELRRRWMAKRATEAKARAEKAAQERAALDARTPLVGKRVRVTSKRSKVPHGTVGTVTWFGLSRYARGATPEHPAHDLGMYRVGIVAQDGKKHYAAATVFEVLS